MALLPRLLRHAVAALLYVVEAIGCVLLILLVEGVGVINTARYRVRPQRGDA